MESRNAVIPEQPGFTLYWDDLKEYLMCLTDREIGRVLRALYEDLFENTEPTLRRNEMLPFVHLKNNALAQEEKYRETRERNRESGRKGGKGKQKEREAVANGCKPTQTQTQTQTQNTNTPSPEGVPIAEQKKAHPDAPAEGGKDEAGSKDTHCFSPQTKAAGLPTPEQERAFHEFRKEYPKKWGIYQSLPFFLEALQSVEAEELLRSLREQKKMPAWKQDNGRYVPTADKWLRERCWEDVPTENDDGYELLNPMMD